MKRYQLVKLKNVEFETQFYVKLSGRAYTVVATVKDVATHEYFILGLCEGVKTAFDFEKDVYILN
jgi:hypothetical protein